MSGFQAAARFWLQQDEEIIKREPPKVPVKPSRLQRKLSEASMKRAAIARKKSSPAQPLEDVASPAQSDCKQPSSPPVDANDKSSKASPAGKRLESKRSSILSKSPFGKRKKKSKKGSSGSGSGRDRSISSPVAVEPLVQRSPNPERTATPKEMLKAAGARGSSLNVAQQVENVPVAQRTQRISSPALSQRPKRAVTKDALQNIIFELIDTERDYLVDLQIIDDVFYGPIEKLQLLSASECGCLFSNVRALAPVNTRLLERFEEAEKAGAGAVNIGRCFIEEAESLKVYEAYCTNQPRAFKLYDELKQTNENLMSYLSIAGERPECRGLDLNSFLIKPLQRICKYPLLLRELVKQTPMLPVQPYNDLLEAEEKIKEIVTYINESKREKEMYEEMIELQRKIQEVSGNGHVGIMDADRKLLQSGELVVITKQFKKVPVLFTLFNNLLVLTKPSYKLYAYVPLGEALINTVGIHDVPYAMEVVHAGNKKLWLSFPTEQECMAMFGLLSELVEGLLKEQMAWFSTPKAATPEAPANRRATLVGSGEAFESFSSKPLPKPPAAATKRIDALKPATPEKPRRFSMPAPRKLSSADSLVGKPSPPPRPAAARAESASPEPVAVPAFAEPAHGEAKAEPAAPESPEHMQPRQQSAPVVPPRPSSPAVPVRSPSASVAARQKAPAVPARSQSAGRQSQVPPSNGLTHPRPVPVPRPRPEDRQSYRELVKSTVALATASDDDIAVVCHHKGRELQVLLPKNRPTYSLFRQRMCRQLKEFAFKATSPAGNLVCDQVSLDQFLAEGVLVLQCAC